MQTATPGTQGSHGRVGALALHMWGWLTSERVCTHLPQTTLVLSMGHVTPSLAGILGVAAATRALHRRPLLGTHLLSLECELKWALESITTNKASGGDGIPIELFHPRCSPRGNQACRGTFGVT